MMIPGLGAYPFPTDAFNLINGRRVSDPANETPNPGDCTPYQCGADPSNTSARQWCSWNGQVGSLPCVDPRCAPYLAQIPTCSLPVVIPPPTIFNPAPAPLPAPQIPTLTPENIVQPLPDITATLQPQPIPVPDCSLWCSINGAIAAHPILALALVAGVAFIIWPKGARAR